MDNRVGLGFSCRDLNSGLGCDSPISSPVILFLLGVHEPHFNNCTPFLLPSHRSASGQNELSLARAPSGLTGVALPCWSHVSGCTSPHTILYEAGAGDCGQPQFQCQDSVFLTDMQIYPKALLSLTVQSQTSPWRQPVA